MNGLREAFELLEYKGENKGYIPPRGPNNFNKVLMDYIETKTGFDSQKYKLSKESLRQAFEDGIIDVAEAVHDEDCPNIEEQLEKKKGKILRKQYNQNLNTYSIVFPLNIRNISSIPSTFSMPTADFERISMEKWEENYENPARDADKTHLNAFLEESPNDLHRQDGFGGVFTFWKTEYEARDYHYALNRVPDIVELLIGQLNFALWEGSVKVPGSPSTDPPNAKWSQLMEPFLYLIFEEGEYLDYWPRDYELRRRGVGGRSGTRERIDRFQNLPSLPSNREDLSGVDELLVNALQSYQSGISESSVHQSFFAFWRGIENLAQVRNQSNEEAIERAKFALDHIIEEDIVRPELQEAIDNLYNKRNNLVHEGPHSAGSRHHRAAAKALLDVLLDLYFFYYEEGFTKDDFRLLLEYGTNDISEWKKVSRVLHKIAIGESTETTE